MYRAAGLLAAYLPILHLELTTTTVLKTLIFLTILATVIPRVRTLRLPGAATAGALTYPIYLLHAHIAYMLLDTFATESTKWLVYTAVTVFVLGLAYALHILVERHPLSRRFWKWLLDGTLGRVVGLLQKAVDRAGALDVRHRASRTDREAPAPSRS